MALAIRIDTLQILPDGRVQLTYTKGQSPLPAAVGSEGIIWPSKADAIAALDDAAARLNAQDLLLMMLAVWRRAQPSMTNPNVVVGKTMTFDLQPTGIQITVA